MMDDDIDSGWPREMRADDFFWRQQLQRRPFSEERIDYLADGDGIVTVRA
jgi:hypothetical protein